MEERQINPDSFYTKADPETINCANCQKECTLGNVEWIKTDDGAVCLCNSCFKNTQIEEREARPASTVDLYPGLTPKQRRVAFENEIFMDKFKADLRLKFAHIKINKLIAKT